MSEQEQGGRRIGRIITTIALLFFLVGMPIGSYIYLKKGYDYQKAARKDLRKEHQMTVPPALAQLWGSTEINLEEYYHLIGLLPEGTSTAEYTKVLQRLHEQFDAPENLLLWTVFEGADSAMVTRFHAETELPQDTSQLLYWSAAPAQFSAFVEDLRLLPDEAERLNDGLILLVDDSLYVRRAFPYQEEVALQQLVERTAILLPERSKPKPELRRSPEL
ncbi:MAG: hypothetical protein AAFN81_08830 [Bacteroidota bacterium]